MCIRDSLGSIRITDKVIAVCAAKAALETNGVYGLVSDFSDTIQKNILGKTSESRGVKISQNSGEIVIDLHITVEYGVKIPSVAWNIQERVKREVEELTEMCIRDSIYAAEKKSITPDLHQERGCYGGRRRFSRSECVKRKKGYIL